MCDSIFGFFSNYLQTINKKYFMRLIKIYIFRIGSIKCRDLRSFLEFKKIEGIKIFFLIFKEFFTCLKI